jgi:CDP-diglyceride synthetase
MAPASIIDAMRRFRRLTAPRPKSRAQASPRHAPVGVLAIVAILSIVGEQLLTSPIHLAGHRAVIWLTALIAVRVASNRAGWATFVGAGAGLATALLGASPMVALTYFLCGVALDTELALLPRLARSAKSMSCVGATVMFVTLIAPAFPTLGHQPAGMAWTIPPALGAIVFGALAAVLGQRLGQHLKRPAHAPLLAAI